MDIRLVLETIYREYFNLFLTIGFRYKLDKKTIEERIQETFEKAFTNINKIRGNSEPEVRSYVIRIFRNQCLLYLRNRKSFVDVMDYEAGLVDMKYDPLHEILLIEELRLRDHAIRRIEPLKYREPVSLYLDGFKPREIAEKIGRNASTTRNLIHRGLKKFEAIIKKIDPLRNE